MDLPPLEYDTVGMTGKIAPAFSGRQYIEKIADRGQDEWTQPEDC
jgi:hypothetical protein